MLNIFTLCLIIYGGGGNRTHVRRQEPKDIYRLSLVYIISPREKPTSRFNPELSRFWFAFFPREEEEGYPVYLDALAQANRQVQVRRATYLIRQPMHTNNRLHLDLFPNSLARALGTSACFPLPFIPVETLRPQKSRFCPYKIYAYQDRIQQKFS